MNELIEAARSAVLSMTTTLGAIEFVYVALSIVGQEFISRRDRRGFYAWGVSNVFGAIMFIALQRWMALMLTLYFLAKNVHGLRTWKRLEAAGASGSASSASIVEREPTVLESAPAR